MPKLILIRGLPGSGKSTLAKQFASSQLYTKHFEADMYFMKEGEYRFDASKLQKAHWWCEIETRLALKNNYDVVVSNTFTTKKELKAYFKIAKEFGITPNVIHCQNSFGTIHNVPEETMDKMRTRWDNDISELFNAVD